MTLYPVTLILVGIAGSAARHVPWTIPPVPAFLTLIMMPLAVSITEGVAFVSSRTWC